MIWRSVETIFGIVLLAGFLACVSIARPRPSSADTAPATSCVAPLKRAPMLCDKVMLDGSAECAVCPDQRACLAPSHIYCVANGCDDARCRAR